MVGTCKCLRHEQDEDFVEREQEQEGGIGRFEGYFASMLLIERFAVVGFGGGLVPMQEYRPFLLSLYQEGKVLHRW